MIFKETWLAFDIDVDRFIAHEATTEQAINILKEGLFSCSANSNHDEGSIYFYEGLKQGLLDRVYFIKPKKSFIGEQRHKGYRLDFGPHQRGEKFYAVGPLLRMDGTNEPITDGCSIQARDSLVLLTSKDGEIEDLPLWKEAEHFILEDLEDFSRSVSSAICQAKAGLWADHYKAMKAILLDGKPFTGKNLETLITHLPIELTNLSGVAQNFGHLGLDPLQHSIVALQVLETSPTAAELKEVTVGGESSCDEIARCAVLFHDLGKKLEPLDPFHAELSGPMAEFHLRCMEYNDLEVAVIKRLVETHDVIGRIKKGEISCSEGYHELCDGLPKSIDREIMVKLHHEIASADMGSIPYLHGISTKPEREELLRLARTDTADGI